MPGDPRDEEIERLRVQLAQENGRSNALLSLTVAQREERRQLVDLLERFADDEPCAYDHDGLCQTHGQNRPCPHPIAHAIVMKGR